MVEQFALSVSALAGLIGPLMLALILAGIVLIVVYHVVTY